MTYIFIIGISLVTVLNIVIYTMIMYSAANHQDSGITQKQGLITAAIAVIAIIANIAIAASLIKLL